MTSLAPGNWLGFLYQTYFSSCWVKLKTHWMSIGYYQHVDPTYCTFVDFLPILVIIVVHRYSDWNQLIPSLGSVYNILVLLIFDYREKAFRLDPAQIIWVLSIFSNRGNTIILQEAIKGNIHSLCCFESQLYYTIQTFKKAFLVSSTGVFIICDPYREHC